MIEIVDRGSEKKMRQLANYLEELLDPQKLADLQIIGKHGDPLSPMDTGLGLTLEDLAKKHPDLYKMYLNSISIHGMVEEAIVEVFE